jgi:type I restriction enzyme, S subunit
MMPAPLTSAQLTKGVMLLAKREILATVCYRTYIFQVLSKHFEQRALSDVLADNFGGAWGEKPDELAETVPTLRSPDIRNGFIDADKAEKRSFHKNEIQKLALKSGDILVIKSNGSLDLVGRSQVYIAQDDQKIMFSNFLLLLRPDPSVIDPRFLDHFLKSAQALSWRLTEQKTTTGLRNLKTQDYLRQFLPIPPFELQGQIVDFLESLIQNNEPKPLPQISSDMIRRFSALARHGEGQQTEFTAQSTYLTKLRQAILQEAIEGKLTAEWRGGVSRPREDAAVLLEKIKAEKAALTTKGKINKEKALPGIEPGEVPFALPEGWVWTRLATFAESMSTGPFGSMLHKSDYVKDGIPIVNPMNIKNGRITADSRMLISEKTRKRLLRYVLKENDIVIARRGNLEKCAVVEKEHENWLCGTGSFFLRMKNIHIPFFLMVYRSAPSQKYLLQDSIGQTMDNLNQKLLQKLPIPLPPLAEQHAIVERVDKLLAMVDQLEQQVAERKVQAEELMQAVLREAFG